MNEDTDFEQTNSTIDKTLTSRVLKGGIWVFIGKIAARGLQLVKLFVLARLLMPEDIGLFGIVILALTILEVFTETGLQTALIQKSENVEFCLDTAWTIQVVRGLFLAVILFFTAPLFSWFFKEPRVIPLLQLLSICEIFRGFKNIGIIYFRKDIDFLKQVAYEFASILPAFIVGIALAWYLRNAWALVWANVAGSIVQCIVSYILHSYRPRLSISFQRSRELFSFGKWMTAHRIFSYIAMRVDRLVLGRLLGATALGFYEMADRIGGTLPVEFEKLANDVMMPAYAKVQNDKVRLKRAFLEMLGSAVCVGFPIAVFLILTAPNFVLVVLGSEWIEAILPLQILSFGALLRSVIGVSSALFIGAGHPNIQFWKSLTRSIVSIGLLFPLVRYFGVPGVAAASVAGVIALTPWFLYTLQITDATLKQLIVAAVPGILMTIAAAMGTIAKRLVPQSNFFGFLLQIVTSSLLVLVVAFWFSQRESGPLLLKYIFSKEIIPLFLSDILSHRNVASPHGQRLSK